MHHPPGRVAALLVPAALALGAACSAADPSGATGIRVAATAPAFSFESAIHTITGQVLRAGSGVPFAQLTVATDGAGPSATTAIQTDGQGLFSYPWSLGRGIGRRTLILRYDAAQVRIETTAIDSASGDQLLVGGPALRVAVWAFDTVTSLINRPLHEGAPGVTRLLPESGAPVEWVVTMAPGSAPELQLVRWSDAVDTVAVAPRALVAVPVSVWLAVSDTAEARARSQSHLEAADRFLRDIGVRLVWSAVDIRTTDAPDIYERAVVPCATGSAPAAPGRLNIYYVRDVIGYGGFSCGGSLVIQVDRAQGALLAHELGHEFGLGHQGPADNVMAMPPGTRLTAGQAFRAHFHVSSGLVTRYRADPIQPVIDCDVLRPGSTRATRCPSVEYDWPPP